MNARKALMAAIERLPSLMASDIVEAADELDMPVSDWLEAVLQAAVAAQASSLSGDENSSTGPDATWFDSMISQERLVPISDLTRPEESATENLDSIKLELEQIRHLVQDCLSVVEPVVRPVQTLPGKMEELSALAEDLRQSAEETRRAANSVRPLERTLLRLAGDAERREPGFADGERAVGSGRLFRR